MKTSWNNTPIIEAYLQNKLHVEDKLAFETRLQVNPLLRMDLYFQKKVYTLLKMFHRKKQKEALEAMHHQLFTDPNHIVFRQQINQLFKTTKR